MFIQPIVDLWTGRPFAYVLTDKCGGPTQPSSPRELYVNVDAAFQRDFTPLVVCRLPIMNSVWESFVKRLPESLWLYEDGQVCSESGDVIMKNNGEPHIRWQTGIDDVETLNAAINNGTHYGSGIALTGIEPLKISWSDMHNVEWGR